MIQEVELKRPNHYGYYKELKVDSYTINGVRKYMYYYSSERFERPIKKAYKISIHESKRVNGIVTKKQYAVTTVEYYSLVDFWIGDCFHDSKLNSIAEALNTNTDTLWTLINEKVDPLQDKIRAEFQQTEEYKTHEKHLKIIEKYNKAKAKFAKTYDCDESEYDYCYNVFGELMNSAYLDKVINDYTQNRSYQKQSDSNYSGYDWSNFKSDYSSYLNNSDSNYTDAERVMLKKFYRVLSKEFHPDNIGGNGDEMQLINKLKGTWKF